MKLNKENILRTSKGINSDSSKSDQTEGTVRFALNAVDETTDGDNRFISNEMANVLFTPFKEDYIQIGDVDINDENKVIFFVSEDQSNSIIAIFNTISGDLNEIVETPDLNFRVNNRIDAEYRLRLGCERVIYFTDGFNSPRIVNLDKLDNYKDENGDWDVIKMKHIRDYLIPNFDDISVISGGNIKAGSYNFDIILLDEDFNPTNWLGSSNTVNMFKDNISKNYFTVHGSSNEIGDELQDRLFNDGVCNKAIQIKLSNLDERFSYYKIAVIQASEGNGIANTVYVSSAIPINQNEFIFDGNLTDYEQISIEELRVSKKIDIETASHNEQIENRYLLADIKGKQIDWCSFQRFASQIKTTYAVKKVPAYEIVKGNSKHPTTPLDNMTFPSDEVVAINIVYVFDDGYVSPEYHIPGRPAHSTEREKILEWNENLAHLYTKEQYDALNDEDKLELWQIEDTQHLGAKHLTRNSLQFWESKQGIYKDRDRCGELYDYWGEDYWGNPLVGKPVRNHKIVSRKTVPLVTYGESREDTIREFSLDIELLEKTLTDCATNIDFLGKDFPHVCDFNGNKVYYDEIVITVSYEINGFQRSRNFIIDENTEYPAKFIIEQLSQNDRVTNVVITGDHTNYPTWMSVTTDISDPTLESALNYNTFINLIGLKFDNVIYPRPDIVGHYITVGLRDGSNRTIIDRGVSNCLRDNDQFIGFNWFAPGIDFGNDNTTIDQNMVFVHNPRFLFENKNIGGSYLKIEGKYEPKTNFPIHENTDVAQDVVDGTSSNGAYFGLIETDDDGIDWLGGFRWVDTIYSNSVPDIRNLPIKTNLFLGPAEKIINYKDSKTLYNTTLDNKTHIFDVENPMPYEDDYSESPYTIKYVSIKVDNDVYPNPENVVSRKAHSNPLVGSGNVVFGGDSYISYLPNTQSTYYDQQTPKRIIESITNAQLILLAAALTVLTAGATTPVLVGVISLAALGLSFEALKVFMKDRERYPKLKDIIVDQEIQSAFGDHGKKDDLLRYALEHYSGIFVESEINCGLRTPSKIDIKGFLEDASLENIKEYFTNKYIFVDEDRGNKNSLRPLGFAEIYKYNNDYSRLNRETLFSPLPITYDCCSECLEEFPNTIYWSEQSFQEERSDNYRAILQNNYRNIDANFGRITDLWVYNNKVYIHTEKMLFVILPFFQEQVKDDLSTFIGTGEFFSLPAQKITDDDNGTLGSRHKWATTKTKIGVVFVSEREGKYLLMDHQGVKAISDIEKKVDFRQIIPLLANDQYNIDTNTLHPLLNAPSNKYGLGFITTYDAFIERLIFTKKDIDLKYTISSEYEGDDYKICPYSSTLRIFTDYQSTIDNYESRGWTYKGIQEDCTMLFEKIDRYERVQFDEEVIETLPSTTDVWVFYDNSGSFSGTNDIIKEVVDIWADTLDSTIPDWQGDFYSRNAQERWLDFPKEIYDFYVAQGLTNNQIREKDILLISFVNESHFNYHGDSLVTNYVDQDGQTTSFNNDYNEFVNDIYPNFKSFRGILYPITMQQGTYNNHSRVFLNHAIASMHDGPFSFNGQRNPAFTDDEWSDFVESFDDNLYTSNLSQYGWSVVTHKSYDGNTPIINYDEFNNDILNELLGNETVIIKVFEKLVPIIVEERVDSIEIKEKTNASHTWSFSLKYNQWRSAHSYLPYYYMHTQRHFFSNIHDNYNIWKHNDKGRYQQFYGKNEPFILEIIFNQDQINTRLWDHLKFITEAKIYNTQSETFDTLKDVTFNKVMFYNSRQNSGVQEIIVKDSDIRLNFFENKINRSPSQILVSNREEDFFINNMRDYVINYDIPMFIKRISDLQRNYYIDKIVNDNVIDFDKSWQQLEKFRDKYLVVRFFLTDVNNVQLVAKYFMTHETYSL